MIIYNKSKAVKVLKAVGLPVLRLFPGNNTVDEGTIKGYFEGNPAAEGVRKECLKVVGDESLSGIEKREADSAKEKNDALNKSQRIIKQKDDKIGSQDKVMKEQSELIAKMMEKISELEKKAKKGK